MAKTAQGAALDRKKLMADPIMVTTIVLLITFLTLFILYPLAILLVDSVLMDGHVTLKIFQKPCVFDKLAVLHMHLSMCKDTWKKYPKK